MQLLQRFAENLVICIELCLQANLSDIFEYTSLEATNELFSMLADRCRSGGRLAYWNMLVPRTPSDHRLQMASDSKDLHTQDRLFYYRSFYCSIRT